MHLAWGNAIKGEKLQMKKNSIHQKSQIWKNLWMTLILFAYGGYAETVGLFYDLKIPQHAFAGSDIKKALEKKGFTVEVKNLTTLSAQYTGKKIVLTLNNTNQVESLLAGQGGKAVGMLGKESYAIRTTLTPDLSHWALGGDTVGAMYGGLQIAENISFFGFTGTPDTEESPYLEFRGIKFNIPLDKRSPTYYSSAGGTSHQLAVEHVWDTTFWYDWFDEMARHRYNFLTLWCNHPFTSLLKMSEYPDVAIQDIEGYNGFKKTMKIEDKIEFWKKVMQRGHDRGFMISFNIWNLFLHGAEGKYGITKDQSNQKTIEYLRKATQALFENYPNLTGFGVTAGEAMTGDDAVRAKFTFETYGKGMLAVAKANPNRKFVFIHREHNTSATDVTREFKELTALKNVRLDLSQKYSQAHMHGAPKPDYLRSDYLPSLEQLGIKTWFTVRNDDFYFLPWGNTDFIRQYINGFPNKDKYVSGVYIGSDGWVFHREVFNKSPYWKNKLAIQKTWYMQKLWGRLMYNPTTSDELFKNHLKVTYPQISQNQLFEAWQKSSNALQLGVEQITGTWDLDFDLWSETWLAAESEGGPFKSLDKLLDVEPMDGSTLCSFAATATNKCGTNISAITTTNKMETLAKDALTLLGTMNDAGSEPLRTALYDLRAMSHLGLYYTNKFRAAIFLKQNKGEDAKTAMANGYCNWIQYSEIMNSLYTAPGPMQRVSGLLTNWKALDKWVLEDYNIHAKGTGTPNCKVELVATQPQPFVQLAEPTEALIYTMQGKLVTTVRSTSLKQAISETFQDLPKGLYLIQNRANSKNSGKPELYIVK